MNQAERAYARIAGSAVPSGSAVPWFFGTDEYYRASKDCLDGEYGGPSDILVRQARLARERQEREAQRLLEEQRQAQQEQRAYERRERALDAEWDRIGCGDFDPQLTEAEERRCDELAGVAP